MKISELIKELEKYNPESEIKITNDNWEGKLKDIESVDPSLNPQYLVYIKFND